MAQSEFQSLIVEGLDIELDCRMTRLGVRMKRLSLAHLHLLLLLLLALLLLELLHELKDLDTAFKHLAYIINRQELYKPFVSQEVQFQDVGNDRKPYILDQVDLHVVVEELYQDAMDLAK